MRKNITIFTAVNPNYKMAPQKCEELYKREKKHAKLEEIILKNVWTIFPKFYSA